MKRNKYILNEETLQYEKLSPAKYYRKHIAIMATLLFTGLLIGLWSGNSATTKYYEAHVGEDYTMSSKHDIVIGTEVWKDSVFHYYAVAADLYIARPEFEGSPIKGDMLALAAWNAYDSTGILIPVELALAQCQWESGMGLKGRSPKNNPYNVGEYDSGTVIWFDSTFEGIQAYYYLMCRNYLSCRSLGELFTSFVNCDGHRYASGDYEAHVPQQYYYIKKWLAKQNLKNPLDSGPK